MSDYVSECIRVYDFAYSSLLLINFIHYKGACLHMFQDDVCSYGKTGVDIPNSSQ